MNRIKPLSLGALAVILIVPALPARAQFCSAAIPHIGLAAPSSEATTTPATAAKTKAELLKPHYSLAFYPFAKFEFAYPGSTNPGTGITFSRLRNNANGRLIVGEV